QVIATWGVCDKPTPENKYCDHKQPGMFIGPEGIAVDGADNVFVAEESGGRIQKLSTDGQPRAIWDLAKLGQFQIPGSLSIDQGGFVYLSDGYNDQVVKFDPNNGNIVGKWGGNERTGEPGHFHGPLGVGVDAGGNVWVSDAQNWRVQ